MSSVLRHVAQIPSRVKFFVVVDESGASSEVPASPAFALAAGDYATIGSMVSQTRFADLSDASLITVTLSPSIVTGNLLKDMGRQITIYNANIAGHPHVAVYREVQIVNGLDTEGVSGTAATGWNSTIFVKVWAADGQNVNVVRTG
jgi:hypothetical protein